MIEQIERQELYCHWCGHYVQFDIDLSMDGNHVLKCPVCGHEHCRVVRNGRITEDRWDSRNGITILVSTSTITVTTNSTYNIYLSVNATGTTSASLVYQSWLSYSSR